MTKTQLILTLNEFQQRALHANEIRDFQTLNSLPEQFANSFISEGWVKIDPTDENVSEFFHDEGREKE